MFSMKESVDPNKKFKICVSGARETSSCGFDSLEIAEKLGQEIAQHDCVLTVGAVTGFPLWVAKGAKEEGGMTIGFSPAANESEHQSVYRLGTSHLDMVVYTGFGLAGCDLLLLRSSDAVIFGCGRIGSIHEFTVAFQEKKPIGILQGSWDTDELLRDILARDIERDHDTIVFDTDPRRLLEQVIHLVKKQREGK